MMLEAKALHVSTSRRPRSAAMTSCPRCVDYSCRCSWVSRSSAATAIFRRRVMSGSGASGGAPMGPVSGFDASVAVWKEGGPTGLRIRVRAPDTGAEGDTAKGFSEFGFPLFRRSRWAFPSAATSGNAMPGRPRRRSALCSGRRTPGMFPPPVSRSPGS
jgi:hypothetical protein